MQKGTIIKPDGTTEVIRPNADFFYLSEVQKVVGGFIELVPVKKLALKKEITMYVNEEGKLLNLPMNPRATALADLGPLDYIVGNALVIEEEPPMEQNDKAFEEQVSKFASKPREIFRKEFGVETEAYVWAAVHGHLQLALRHPQTSGPSSKLVQEFADALLVKLRDTGVYTQEEFEFVKAEQEKFLNEQRMR